MERINEIFKAEIEEELLYSLKIAIQNDEIISYVLKNKGNSINAILLSEEKLYSFSLKDKKSNTNVYTIDEIRNIVVDVKKKSYFISILLENGDEIYIDDLPLAPLKNFKETYDKVSSVYDDLFSKNKKSNENKNLVNQKKSEEISNQKPQKFQKVINDSKISLDTTFSSNYLNDVLSKRNVTLPSGSLTNIDKIWTKLDSLEIDVRSIENNITSKSDKLNSELIRTNEEFSKLDLYTRNELKKIIDLNKENLSETIKNEISFLNQKIDTKVSNLEKSDEKNIELIYSIKQDIDNKLSSIKNEQVIMSNNIKKALDDYKTNTEEIYVTQKAWIEINRLIKKNEDSLFELEDFFKKHLQNRKDFSKENDDIRNQINSLKTTISNFMDENLIFNKTLSEKILLIDNKIQEDSSYIEKIKNLELENESLKKENALISKEIKDLFNVISNISQELKYYKKEKESKSTSIPFFDQETFTAKSYTYKNIRRFGLRSGQVIRKNTLDTEIGMDALYVSDKTGKYLDISKYNGVIFKNQKYYFNDSNGLDNTTSSLCEISILEYDSNLKPFRNIKLIFYKDYVEYKVFNERGEIINDSNPNAYIYDLQKLTFFKE